MVFDKDCDKRNDKYLNGRYKSTQDRQAMQKIFLQILGTFLDSLNFRINLGIQKQLFELIWLLFTREVGHA